MSSHVAPTEPLLSVAGLSVSFRIEGGLVRAVDDVSFDVGRGEVLALVGESGSGKSVTAMSILGLTPPNARTAGSITFDSVELLGLAPGELRRLRGRRVATVFQEPMTALNPVYTVGAQISEAIRCHEDVSKARARERSIELLRKVGIPDPERRVDSYPHQLSGGQRQRAMIAIAVSGEPDLIIADEPTTALDVTVQAEILELLRGLQADLGAAVLLITHDMGVVADLADRVVVMKAGEVVEEAPATALFASPGHDYTQRLLDSVPRPDAVSAHDDARYATTPTEDVLSVEHLDVTYKGKLGRPGYAAVRDVSFSIGRGRVLGLVGESGSGKSTIGRAVVGLTPPSGGEVVICGRNVTGLSTRRLRPLRRRYSMVFQDPGSSLNPRATIGESIAASMIINRYASRRQIDQRVTELLDQVELPGAWINRYPHELSGGQRQRVGLARALALDPELLIADEPTSALDVSVQATVLRLLQDLQERLAFSCLFISHDLGVVELLADDVAVLQGGEIVEMGATARVLGSPTTSYTKRLVAAAPVPDPSRQQERRQAWLQMESA